MNKGQYVSPCLCVKYITQADIVTASVTYADGEFLMEDIFYES